MTLSKLKFRDSYFDGWGHPKQLFLMTFFIILIFTFAKSHICLAKFWKNKNFEIEILRVMFVCIRPFLSTFLFVVFIYFNIYLCKIAAFVAIFWKICVIFLEKLSS